MHEYKIVNDLINVETWLIKNWKESITIMNFEKNKIML